jgi:hypothetical protein
MFGILTTYSEWRVCWLHNTDTAANSKDLLAVTGVNIKNANANNSIPDWQDDYIDTDPEIDPEDAGLDRTFYGTKVFQCTNTELPNYLVSVLLKMYHSPHSKVQLVDPSRPYIQLKEGMWTWSRFTKALV